MAVTLCARRYTQMLKSRLFGIHAEMTDFSAFQTCV